MSADIPDGWATATIGDVIEDIQPGFASGEKAVVGGVAHLRMNNIGRRGELNRDLIRSVPTALATSHYDLRPGDVLVCTTNSASLVGKCAYFDLDGRYAFSNHLTRLRPAAQVMDGRFLRWTIWLQWRTGEFDGKCKHWVNQSSLPKDALLDSEIMVPPLAEQRRIVAKLEQLLATVDACQQGLTKVSVLLERLRQSVLAAACSGRLTADWREEHPSETAVPLIEAIRLRRPSRLQDSSVRTDLDLPDIPESWMWTNLRFLLSPAEAFCYGVVQPGEDDPNGIFLVRAGDLNCGHVDPRTLRRISKHVHHEYRRSQLNGGEILVTVVGAGIGETAIAQQGCAGFNIARALAKLPVRECEPQFVRLWLTTGHALRWMKSDSREVARPTLNLEQLQTLPVPIAPLAEQQELIRRVEGLFALADQIEKRLEKATTQINNLTPSVVTRALKGGLVPAEAELASRECRDYEPAYDLLKRLRRERTDHIAPLKRSFRPMKAGRNTADAPKRRHDSVKGT